MISHNLLTSEKTISGTELKNHDREVLKIIGDWKSDPDFDQLSEYLEIMGRRVSPFVEGENESSR